MREPGFRQLMEEAQSHPDYWYESAILDFTEAVYEAMQNQGVTRTELARRLCTSQAYVTRVLSGNANFTLKTMSKLAFALGLELEVALGPRHESVAATPRSRSMT